MRFSEAFSRYNAKPQNINWSVCAETPEGDLVISLWSHYFGKPKENMIRYKDTVSRWAGPGNAELREALDRANQQDQRIRAVIAETDDREAVSRGEDASKLKKTFKVKEDWFGKLILWDGETFEIEFTRE